MFCCLTSYCRLLFFFFFQAEDGIRDLVRSRGLGDVYKRQVVTITGTNPYKFSVTLPTINAGDILQMYVTATITAIATAEFVWREMVEDSTLWGVIRPG